MWENIAKKDKIENEKRNEYIIDSKENKEISIDIISTIQQEINPYNNKIYKKIAPGCKRKFYFKIK